MNLKIRIFISNIIGKITNIVRIVKNFVYLLSMLNKNDKN